MKKIIPLCQLPIGNVANVINLIAEGKLRRRLLDLGLIKDTKILALHKSPAGDPIAYDIRGAVIALRSEESRLIMVECD